jgi:hypothetical protein
MGFLEAEPSELFPNIDSFDNGNIDFSDIVTAPMSPKYQIRHHDCMWSGTCVDKSHPSKKKGLNLCSTTTSTSLHQQSTDNSIATTTTSSTSTTLQKSIDSNAVKIVTQKNIMTPNNIIKNIMCKNSSSTSSNGKLLSSRSLLINSNTNQNNNQAAAKINTNTAALTQSKSHQQIQLASNQLSAKDIECRNQEFDSFINANLRPDTPLSLGDDVPELRQNIDLTPCPSSNRMKFTDQNSSKFIHELAEHLKETSNNFSNDSTSSFLHNYRHTPQPSDLNEILKDITFLSDYEEFADDSSIIDMDEDDDHDYKMSATMQKAYNTIPQAPRVTINHHEFISDHSYTRPKGSRYDPIALGVQTPSDSGRFIFVIIFN